MLDRTNRSAEARRLSRERKTVSAMVRIYCRGVHGSGNPLCESCAELHAYAMCRLDRCPFGSEKPTCAECTIHCYKVDRRDAIRAVMRYAGPRLLWRHPWLAIRHLLDGRRSRSAMRRTATAAAASAPASDDKHQR